MTCISSIKSLILDLPPSCIEFCPVARDYFVVGTYYLEKSEEVEVEDELQDTANTADTTTEDEKKEEDDDEDEKESGNVGEKKNPQVRTGSLVLFKLEGDEIMQISTTPTPYAILDIHFSPHDPTLLAIATSTGLIELYNLSLNITLSNSTSKIKTSTEASLTYLSTHKPLGLETTPTLILSLSWHPALPSKLAITVSTGQVYLIDTEEAKDGSKKELLVHDLEAWTVAFARQGDGLFSGGDDAALRFTGLPVPDACDSAIKDHKTSLDDGQEDEEEEEEYLPNWSDTRAHTAGVTAILPLLPLPLTHHHHHHAKTVKNNNIIITGSYDDNIRILHTPLQGRKRVLAEENLQGGVWRLNMLCEHVEDGRYILLASCMHAGARIVEVKSNNNRNQQQDEQDDDEWTINVLAKFQEHKSMNYASHVQPGSTRGGEQTIISTSFYDKLLCLWRFTLP